MPGRIKRASSKPETDGEDITTGNSGEFQGLLGPELSRQITDIFSGGMTPSSTLNLVMNLIVQVPTASKEAMEQIKMLDKLINTARAMLETRIKSEEAAALGARLDEMERQLEQCAAAKAVASTKPQELWTNVRRR